MKETAIRLHPSFRIGPVDPRLYGGFLEHLGRAVYGGVYDPGSRHAGADGLRTDVLDALRGLGMTVMRYPGGNFASGYHWADGVGPRANRPAVRDLAWQSTEPNAFGTEEFLAVCRAMRWDPMITVNLGTGTPEEAGAWVEYCNSPAGTRFADRRAASGRAEPHGVKLWCLGNEMDGPWQLGHVPAADYARLARQAAKIMKDADRGIELVAGGSCGATMPTFMEWDRIVLETLGDAADYLSLHRYSGNRQNDTAEFLAEGVAVDRQIEAMDAACRFAQARLRSTKRAWLCFDEWNVWYRNRESDGRGKVAPSLLEERYNLEDALVVAGFFNSFLRHANVVKIANLAQIVNVIAPVMTRGDRVLKQTIYWPFAMYSARRRGDSLRVAVEGPDYETKAYGRVPMVDASAILDGRVLHVFLVNRSTAERAPVDIRLADRDIVRVVNGEMLAGTDAKAENTFEAPDAVRPRPIDGVSLRSGRAFVEAPPLSLTALTLETG